MSLLYSIILGIVEGLTEFLPISSTAHLIFTSKLLHIPQTDFLKFFEVFIQSGAILAVVFLYWQYLLTHKSIRKKILVSFVPTASVGFLLYRIIKNIFFESYILIIAIFLTVGILFLLTEYLIKKRKISINRSIKNLSLTEALIIGFSQSLAVIPGVSRAGIVMISMLFLGYKRDEAAVYSFILAVPTILAASVFDLIKTDFQLISDFNHLLSLIVGFLTAFSFAYISIKWFINYLQKNSLVVFGLYRMLIAIILLII